MKATATPKRARGVTLVELLTTIVIIGIALAAVTSSVTQSVRRSADPLIQHKMILLGQAYADEILGKRFSESTPIGGIPAVTGAAACTIGSEAGEARALFDDVDDYDGLVESPPQLQSGAALNGYNDFSASVSVSCAGTALGLGNDYDAKVIDISISSADGRSTAFRVYRGNY